MAEAAKENWRSGDAYETYVGRWSRKVAIEFLSWLELSEGLTWADIGCGTGALAEAILARCAPRFVNGVDKSAGFIAQAQDKISDPRANFEIADATALPWDPDYFDVSVSALTLNFVPNHEKMACEMVRVTKPSGLVVCYVWDYAGDMEMMRYFWEAALAATPSDAKLAQGVRFPFCQPQPLQALFEGIGLTAVSVRALDIPTVFEIFSDFWNPFLGKQGAAPTYLASVDDETRARIRETLRNRLTPSGDTAIHLKARAWAVKGFV